MSVRFIRTDAAPRGRSFCLDVSLTISSKQHDVELEFSRRVLRLAGDVSSAGDDGWMNLMSTATRTCHVLCLYKRQNKEIRRYHEPNADHRPNFRLCDVVTAHGYTERGLSPLKFSSSSRYTLP